MYSQTLVRSAVMYFRDVLHVQSNFNGGICCDVFWRHAPCTVKQWWESAVMYFGDMLHVQSNIGEICS